jgi:hypothetical protein
MTSRLDGSSKKILAEADSIGCATSLQLDLPLHVLYFVNKQKPSIELYQLDKTTKSHKTFQTAEVNNVESVIIYQDELLWSLSDQVDYGYESGMGVIVMTNKFSEWQNVEPVVQNLVEVPKVLHLFQGGLQTVETNPCQQVHCSHICLMQSQTSAVCACPSGMKLLADGKHCEVDWSKSSLVTVDGSEILHMTLDYIGGVVSNVVHTSAEGNISALAYDWTKRTLYYAVQSTDGRLACLHLDSNTTELLFTNVSDVIDMDIDEISHNIYWVSRGQSHLNVGRYDGFYKAVLLTADNSSDLSSYYYTAISVDSKHKKLYYATCGTSPYLGVCNLVGTDCTTVTTLSDCIRGLHFDSYSGTLYWADASKSQIVTLSHGESLSRFIRFSPQPNSIVTTSEHFIWTDVQLSEVQFLSKESYMQLGVIYTGRRGLGDLIVIDDQVPLSDSVNGCSLHNGGCSELCIPSTSTLSGQVCLCSGEVTATGQSCATQSTKSHLSYIPSATVVSYGDQQVNLTDISSVHNSTNILLTCSIKCQNGGTCLVSKQRISSCSCTSEFSGKFCEEQRKASLMNDELSTLNSVHVWLVITLGVLAAVSSAIIGITCTIKHRRSHRMIDDNEDKVQHYETKLVRESSFTNTNKSFSIPRPKLV